MNCRIDITVRKTWNDSGNAHGQRPASVGITLYRNDAVHLTATLNAAGGWKHTFACLPVNENSQSKYVYRIDETDVPGYTKKIDGFNITNTLNQFTITGTKIWNDNHNAAGDRPGSVTVNLLRNGAQFNSTNVASPAGADTAAFTFANVSFADAAGVPYVYTVDEAPVANYTKAVKGFDITNTRNAITPNSV